MDASELDGVLAFLREAERLKQVPRNSWTSTGERESVAEHTWRLCLMALLFAERFPGLDTGRLLQICLVHDLGEAIGGDIPAPQQAGAPSKAEQERQDLLTLLAPLPERLRARLTALWDEYEGAATREAQVAKALDKLETILQHNQGANPADFDYAFNLAYGARYTDATPALADVRARLDADTRRLAEQAARAALAPTGTLRAGINFGNAFLTRRATAERAAGGIAPDLAQALAERLGVPLALVPYETAGAMADAAASGAWDVAFLAAEPERAGEIDFSAPYLEIDAGFAVAPGLPIARVEEVDRAGIRIAAQRAAAFELYLSRTLAAAELVRAPTAAAAAERFVAGEVEVLAGLRETLHAVAAKRPGARVLPGRFTGVQQAIGVPRGRAPGAAFVRAFVEELRASGRVRALIAAHGVAGVTACGTHDGEAR